MFAKAVRDARKAAKMSQAELGKAIGTSPQYISQVENGSLVPSDDRIKKIEEALGVTFSVLPPVSLEELSVSPLVLELIAAAKALVESSYTIQIAETKIRRGVELLSISVSRVYDTLPKQEFSHMLRLSEEIARKAAENEVGALVHRKRSNVP